MLLLLVAYLANCDDTIVYQVNCKACGSKSCFDVTGGYTLNFATTQMSCSTFNNQLSQITNITSYHHCHLWRQLFRFWISSQLSHHQCPVYYLRFSITNSGKQSININD